MIVDSSALVALVLREPGHERLRAALRATGPKRMSVANLLETAIVIDSRYDPAVAAQFDRLVETLGIEPVAVTVVQARLAREAHRRFGKGRHAAGLTFGDCFAYALAAELDEPLLFVGDDFGLTDIRSALAS